jgi:hypothetical protein
LFPAIDIDSIMGHASSRSKVDMTTTLHVETHGLATTITNHAFFTIDERELLLQIKVAFASELERLKSAKVTEQASPVHRIRNGPPSPSMVLYGEEFNEVNRTLVGLLCLRWIYNDQYEHFTQQQAEGRRLQRPSFDWLRDYFHQNLNDPEDVLPLVISMIINDLGKDPSLAEEVAAHFDRAGESLPEQNHDSLLFEAANIPGMIQCLDMLDDDQRTDLLLGLELGSELNAGQLAQAESVPINLEFLQHMQNREHAFELKFMEQILDVAGGLGHVNPNGAVNLIQPVFETFKTVHDVSIRIIKENLPLREAYDHVLQKREKLLVNVGFRRLSVSSDRDRALLRLLTMGRTVDFAQAELFATAFEALEDDSRANLIRGLNIDGNVNERAVLPYYMPAVIADTLQTTKDCSTVDRRRALTSLMRYLAKVFHQSPKFDLFSHSHQQHHQNSSSQQHSPTTPTSDDGALAAVPGIVIEHNMMKVREVINSPGFAQNPDMLDDLEIPAGQQLQRRRTSHSLASGEGGSSEFSPKTISRSGTNLSAAPILE